VSTLDRAGAQALADRVCRLSDGVALQATVTATRRRLTRLGNGVVLFSGHVDDTRVLVRAVLDGAEGTAFTNDLSQEGLTRAVGEATAAARVAPPVSGHPGLPDSAAAGEPVAVDAWDEGTAVGDLSAEAAAVGAALAAARGRDTRLAGVFVRSAWRVAVANTLGLHRVTRGTSVQARLIATCRGASGHAGVMAGSLDTVDLPALADRAAAVAVAGQEPVDLAPGRFDVVLEPPAVIELLNWLAAIGFRAKGLADGTSFLADRLGTAVTGDRVTIRDPGPDTALLPVPFDQEGVARQPVTFIEGGIGRAVVHDRRSGARAGCSSTGHWRLDERFPEPGASPGGLELAAGTDTGDLVSRLEHGLHIHRFHYVNGFLDPRRARMTGLTRDGVFEVRHGRPVHPVRDLRFTEDVLDALGRIDGIGAVLSSVATFRNTIGGAMAAPQLLVRDFAFTGRCAP